MPRKSKAIKVGNVVDAYGSEGEDSLDYEAGVEVRVGKDTYLVGVGIGIPESKQGSARASGAMESYGGGPDAWWAEDGWVSLPQGSEDSVLDAIDEDAFRLFRQAQAVHSGRNENPQNHRSHRSSKSSLRLANGLR